MKTLINTDCQSNNIFHQWEPRSKLLAFTLLLFSFAMVKSIELAVFMLVICSVIFFLSGIPFRNLLKRWKIPAVLVLVTGTMLLFLSEGHLLASAGPFKITREGLIGFTLITSRVMSIITLIVILFETTPLLTIITAMRNLGLPRILADMTLFTLRYLYTLHWQLEQMKTAMVLRGFAGNKISSWKEYAILIGGIMVRSFDQSERVYRALAVRGYGFEQNYIPCMSWSRKDKTLCYSFAVLALMISSIQIYLNMPGV